MYLGNYYALTTRRVPIFLKGNAYLSAALGGGLPREVTFFLYSEYIFIVLKTYTIPILIEVDSVIY